MYYVLVLCIADGTEDHLISEFQMLGVYTKLENCLVDLRDVHKKDIPDSFNWKYDTLDYYNLYRGSGYFEIRVVY